MADTMNMTEVRDSIVSILKNHVCSVVFEKVDGSIRKMKCTLKEETLPESVTITKSKKKDNPDVVAVYDVESDGWRSFRIDRMLTMEIVG